MTPAISDNRLTPTEREAIRLAVAKACEETGTVWRRIVLFGSRTDPNRRGGDIDLLVELDPRAPADVYRVAARLRIDLEDMIGEQRVDLVIDDGRSTSSFPELARKQGVELWSNT